MLANKFHTLSRAPDNIAPESRDLPDHHWLPWAWCNLRRNPFGELLRQERVELAVVDITSISAGVSGMHTAVQLIGDCGRGKTTRMLVLAASLENSAYVYLPEDQPCPSIPEGRPLLIDEAQRLPRAVRRQVFATGLPLVLATHRDLTRPLTRAGYQVTTHKIGTTNDPRLVRQLLNRRIRGACLDPRAEVPELSAEDAVFLVQRFGSNIRAIENYLYEVVQTQVFSHGQMRFVDPVG